MRIFLFQCKRSNRAFSSRDPNVRAQARRPCWCTAGARGKMELHRSLSVYAKNLPEAAKKRYEEKISVINGLDPFGSSPGEAVPAAPPVDASDLVA